MNSNQMMMPEGSVPAQDIESPKEDLLESGPSLLKFISETNIADSLKDEELAKIGKDAYEGYQRDLESRKQWENDLENWTKLALQVREERTYPWPKSANVKYPLLSTAAMQFSARAYPALIPANGQVVKAKVVGFDPSGEKTKKADRVSKHMSYQIMEKMHDWEDNMDKLLLILPIVGTCFKKTYWDGSAKENCSKLILPKDLVVNYWARDLESAERKTERMEMSPRLVKERQNQGIFRDVTLPTSRVKQENIDKDKLEQSKPSGDDTTTPYLILEQHTYLDLDEDGYPEPYIITIEEQSKLVLRITARFDMDGVETEGETIVKIQPVEYYTKYEFIPNPDGGFYSVGFGLLLGTLNDAVNTLINQLIDAGTLSNLQSGFIGKGLRLKMGDAQFKPGEWKGVNATADDLKKQIFPLPVREPSNVLFQLLGTLVQSSKELASVAEIFTGKMPGQNTPATTTMATIEQGSKVFTAIHKRVYRSLTKEFKKIFRLNRIYLDPQEQTTILDMPVQQSDYEDKGYDICPAADPSAVSGSEKVAKFEAAMQLFQLGQLDPKKVTMLGMEVYEIPGGEQLLIQGPPPPDPKQQEAQMKMQIEQQKAQLKAQESQMKMQIEAMKAEMDKSSKQAQMAMEAQMNQMKLEFEQAKLQLQMQKTQLDVASAAIKSKQDLATNQVKNEQSVVHSQQQHEMKMKQTKETKPNDK